jgi:hypothetical protein
LETTNDAASKYSMSRKGGINRSDATEDKAAKTARHDAEQLRPDSVYADDRSTDDALDATQDSATRSANDNTDTTSESAAEGMSAESAPAQTDDETPTLLRVPENSAAVNGNGALRSRTMPVPAAPSVTAPVAKAPSDEAADLSAQSSATATASSRTQASATPAKNKKPLAQLKTSSTRAQRKRILVIALPRSGFLRVQVRWPLGATQTVWSGRGVRGQKLRIEVSAPQDISSPKSRNKNARLQVSVQEAAPLLNTSRISWKTIAREEIAIQ